jgi:hypothetical protein
MLIQLIFLFGALLKYPDSPPAGRHSIPKEQAKKTAFIYWRLASLYRHLHAFLLTRENSF